MLNYKSYCLSVFFIFTSRITCWFRPFPFTSFSASSAIRKLKRMEEFRKAQAEVEQKKEKTMSQKMFKVI
ncbi:MAG TPA: hypothetical protein DCY19_08510 [Eubacterium sp.]|nr:hypothetical protein [Eubacterium sp.]